MSTSASPHIEASDDSHVIKAVGLVKSFSPRAGLLGSILGDTPPKVRAVDNVTISISRAEIVSLVGESGSGKSTLGELLTLLRRPDSGNVLLNGTDLSGLSARKLRPRRRNLQVVFQDPYQTLDPRMTVYHTVAEPLEVNENLSGAECRDRVTVIIEEVGLKPASAFLDKYPRELSGGQRQRVAIARALVLKPAFVVADEPVSMLDVSVASGILNLMLDLRSKLGTAFLFITHDLSVARYVGDRVAIMHRGRIVELGPTEAVIGSPLHPYTRLLIESIPEVDSEDKRSAGARDVEPTVLEAMADGCKFQYRCPLVMDVCRVNVPELVEVQPNHFVACFKHSDLVAPAT